MQKVKVFIAFCPIGECGCYKDGKILKRLGKTYGDPQELRQKVLNHVQWSTYHKGHDPHELELLMEDPAAWSVEQEEEWSAEDLEEAFADLEGGGNKGGGGKAAGCGKGGGGKSGGGKAGGGKAGKGSSSPNDDWMQSQLTMMMHFSKAAANCVQALTVASRISRAAADTFDAERLAMQDSVDDMVAAFGVTESFYSPRANMRIMYGDQGGDLLRYGSSAGSSASANSRHFRGRPY